MDFFIPIVKILWWSAACHHQPALVNWMNRSWGVSTSAVQLHPEDWSRPTAQISSAAACLSTGGVIRHYQEPLLWVIYIYTDGIFKPKYSLFILKE